MKLQVADNDEPPSCCDLLTFSQNSEGALITRLTSDFAVRFTGRIKLEPDLL